MKKILIVCMVLALASLPVLPGFVVAEDTASSVPAAEPAVEPGAAPEPLLDSAPPAAASTASATEETVSAPADAGLLSAEPQTPTGSLDSIQTRFLESGGPQGADERAQILALWETRGTSGELSGRDDSQEVGAQLLPSDQFRSSKPFSVCAVVVSPGQLPGFGPIFSEVGYPESSLRTGQKDCERPKTKKQQMEPAAKDKGQELVCNYMRSQNANLPAFFAASGYDQLCGQGGKLQKETARVYCADYELQYDDPSGEYAVSVYEKNQAGEHSRVVSGAFQYLELTAFEIDFADLDYGKVELNQKKTIEGDTVWQGTKTGKHPTVRNVGNTRMQTQVLQDDMGLGKTNGVWNIKYGSRVGTHALWKEYWPGEAALLDAPLGLGSVNSMDFTVEVSAFPQDNIRAYSGQMTIDARKAEPAFCGAGEKTVSPEGGADRGG